MSDLPAGFMRTKAGFVMHVDNWRSLFKKFGGRVSTMILLEPADEYKYLLEEEQKS